jgi:hypothetical protein
MTCYVALVTDRAGSFVTLLRRPFPRLIEDGRILVTTLGTFDGEREALAFLRGLRSINEKMRARTAEDLEALERHGFFLSRAGNA